MSSLSIYIGFSMLLFGYFFQTRAAIVEASTTLLTQEISLNDFLFGSLGKEARHWPFFAITIFFPFIISALPLLLDLPAHRVSIELDGGVSNEIHTGLVFVSISKFAINFLVVLITVEFSLMYKFRAHNRHWQNLLLAAISLDIVMFAMLSFANTSIELGQQSYNSVANGTVLFLIITCGCSFLSSLFVIVSIRVMNDFDTISLSKLKTSSVVKDSTKRLNNCEPEPTKKNEDS